MTVVNPKSISGITSITTASGSDNLLTIHTSDASNTERFRIDSTGTTKIVTGIVTTLTATTGIVTTLTANTVTANTTAKVGSGITLSPAGDVFATGVTTCLGTAVLGNAIIGSGTTITSDGVNAGIITATDIISRDATPSLRLEDSENGYYAFLDGNSGNLILHSDKGAGNSDSNMKFAIDNATKMTLTADGELGVGGSFDPSQMVDVRKSDSSTFNATSNLPTMIRAYNTSSTNGNCAGIQIRSDNSAGAAGIQYIHTVTSSTNYDSDLVFSRRLATSGSYAETARFTNAGNLAFPNGKGIDFSAQTATSASGSSTSSEILHHYEEGTWTPSLVANGGGNSVNGEGAYTKIGDIVHALWYFANVDCSVITGNQNILLQGLPFASHASHQNQQPSQFFMYNITWTAGERETFYFPTNSTYLGGYRSRSGTTWLPWSTNSFQSGSTYFMASVTYKATY